MIDSDSIIIDPDTEEKLELLRFGGGYATKEGVKTPPAEFFLNEDDIEHHEKSIYTIKRKKTEKKKGSKVSVDSMDAIPKVLAKVYDNPELRSSIVPLFLGDPGLGKTKFIEKFAKERGATLVELITSQMSPFEISGIAMPDKESKKMTIYNYDRIEQLKDGDIIFFDELLNGNPTVLNACLTILEQRTLISGKKLPDVMIVAAANPQGMVPLTPQIKERFLWYNVKFSKEMWQDYMHEKYQMPYFISKKLALMIEKEELLDKNFYTPRSVDKAVQMILMDCPTPYSDRVTPVLNGLVRNAYRETKVKIGEKVLKPGETASWLSIKKGK